MNILPVEKIREADAFTIQHEPIASIDLMERAAQQCFKWIRKRADNRQAVSVFCGPGNNGGDGLVIARLLAKKKYAVSVFIVRISENESEDFTTNLNRLNKMGQIEVTHIRENDVLPAIPDDTLIVDAIFGSGLSRPVSGFTAQLIRKINSAGAITVSIDTPSGLFSDENTSEKKGAVIEADYTLSFQFPKFAFLFPENDRYVGQWHILPIGLMPEFTNRLVLSNFFVEKEDAIQLLKTRNKFDHKGKFGHALLISGSYGKMGAAILTATAALCSGAGLVTAHVPKIGYSVIQTALPECMVSIDDYDECFGTLPTLQNYNAIAIGPGIGTQKITQNALKLLIQNSSVPLLFDADAINILAENKTWLSFVPVNSIFTPHPKEFERLAGKSSNDFERNKMQREFSIRHQAFVVLKGAHTCLSTPSGICFFNSTGNPGMATGGSGDVLTGVILSLLAQNYHPQEACILGVYLHGLAGDIAAKRKTQYAMIAGDITDNLGKAFGFLLK